MSLSKDEQRRVLATEVFSRCCLVGEFTLRSGRTANRYFDKYQFESDPELLAALAAEMVALVPDDIDLLAGLEMGGIPVVTALAAATGIPAVFVRKVAKEYGTARLAEGPSVAGKRVLIVEDVVTSGGQIRLSAADLRDIGALVVGAVCVIDREEGGSEILAEDGIVLSSLFGAAELEAAGATYRPSWG
ncbi:MAG: orotate phosphoribosyltransferase [Acidimicrobiaceae bacterium]|nr:orotate phosphoribosyltransferase [Acidimicrobiaceae bacterium]MYG56080.1 orotate phosphoribosyltransferase [Acidimicrobiaceae bacterium]MYK00074.1 orotate phosphoribosyltransferase [Acidimicrobiaceae bacterium]